ncbi:MAG: carbohydrate ABC transporter permease [Desulfurococcales archaeon]|jgi:inositol-phosphate transport system permease protein
MSLGRILISLLAMILILLGLSPYALILLLAFSEKPTSIQGFTIDNFAFIATGKLLQDPRYSHIYPNIHATLVNTLFLALGVSFLVTLLSSMTGYALSRYPVPGRRAILATVLALHGIPVIILLIGLYFVLRFIGLFNTLIGVILAKVVLDLPLGIWIMKNFYDNLPWDIEIASIVDGAGRFTTWLRIMLPLAKPGIAALAVLEFISGWGEFILVYTLVTSNTNWTLSMVIRGLIGEMGSVNLNLLAALSIFYLIPVLIFFIATQKYLLRIAFGGVRG